MRRSFGAAVISAWLVFGDGPADAAAQTTPLDDLGFMSGCWEGSFGSGDRAGTIEERYTSPSSNLMLGTTRYIRGGETVMFEFTRISADSTGVVLLPFPRGVASEHGFRLTEIDDRHAVFEAPEHDFPKRISYTVAHHGLTARIDDGTDDGESSTWELMPRSCDTRRSEEGS